MNSFGVKKIPNYKLVNREGEPVWFEAFLDWVCDWFTDLPVLPSKSTNYFSGAWYCRYCRKKGSPYTPQMFFLPGTLSHDEFLTQKEGLERPFGCKSMFFPGNFEPIPKVPKCIFILLLEKPVPNHCCWYLLFSNNCKTRSILLGTCICFRVCSACFFQLVQRATSVYHEYI